MRGWLKMKILYRSNKKLEQDIFRVALLLLRGLKIVCLASSSLFIIWFA